MGLDDLRPGEAPEGDTVYQEKATGNVPNGQPVKPNKR